MTRLPAASVALISGISAPLHTQWVQKRILTPARYGDCTESQAFEAAVAAVLKRHIKSLSLLRTAMGQARPRLQRIGKQIPKKLDLVWIPKLRLATWAQGSTELAAAVRVSTFVVVLPMSETLAEVREAFSQEVSGRMPAAEPILSIVRPTGGK